jgi:hypothetical protein
MRTLHSRGRSTDARVIVLSGLGQAATPVPVQNPSSAPASEMSGGAKTVLFGGVIGGIVLAIVGNVMGQHRLLTEHIFKKNRRRARRRHS